MAEPRTEESRFLGLIKNGDYLLAAAMFGVVIVLVLPVPKPILDTLLVMSISSAILILLVTVYVREHTVVRSFPRCC